MLEITKKENKVGYHASITLNSYEIKADTTGQIVYELSKVSDFSDPEYQTEYFNNICLMNGSVFDPENDYVIALWQSSSDLGSCDITSDGFHVTIDGQKYYGRVDQYVPMELVRNWKQCETHEVKIPLYLYSSESAFEDRRRDYNDRYYDVAFNAVLSANVTVR